MDIGQPVRDLGDIDISALSGAVLGLEDADWLLNQYRQGRYEVHRQTQSVVMLFTDGAGWPDIEVVRESGWSLIADAAGPLMSHILERHYPPGGTVIRAMAVKLAPGGLINTHRDTHASFHYSHRIHVPIATNSSVHFTVAGKPFRLEVGKAYEVNNQEEHSVMNKGAQARIHFIFDYLPPQHLGQVS